MSHKSARRSPIGLWVCVIATAAGCVSSVAKEARAAPDVAVQGRALSPPSKAAKPPVGRGTMEKDAGQYFVEFRSRYALSYGHTFAAHGKLNARGEVGKLTEEQVAGLHPAGDSPIPWMIGHVAPVVSETGPSDGDLDDQYVSARYRVTMNKTQYDKVATYIKQLRSGSPVWHATLYNCNAFVADIAKSMGLRTPFSTLLLPADFINSLRDLNEGQPHAAAVSASLER